MSLYEFQRYLQENLTIEEQKELIYNLQRRKYLIEHHVLSLSQLIEKVIGNDL